MKTALANFYKFLNAIGTLGDSSRQFPMAAILLGRYLNLPLRELRSLLKRNRNYLASIESLRNQKQPRVVLKNHVQSFRFEHKSQFLHLINADKRSRLLVSYHFGDFVYGNNALAKLEEKTRDQFFLTQLHPTSGFTSNMHTAFAATVDRPKQLTTDSCTALSLVRLLKKDNTTLLTFMDLPKGFGERVKVKFFGKEAWFPKGPASIALLAKAPILPILNISGERNNEIKVFPQIEPVELSTRNIEEAVRKTTQQLVSHLEGAISLYPWQWRFLTNLPSFFENSEADPRSEKYEDSYRIVSP